MNKKRILVIGSMLIIAALSSCAHQPDPTYSEHAPGFFSGLFQGFVAPITLFLGWLWEGRIYAFPNTGWFYDLGFMIGISAWGGGAAASR